MGQKFYLQKKNSAEIIKDENNNEPTAPEIVLFGLIFVNFGPFKIFPNTNPPMSEAIQVNSTKNKIIFKWKKKDNEKKYIQKINIYVVKNKLHKNCFILFFL